MKLKTKTRVALCVAALSGTGITASQVIASDIEPYSVPVSIKGEKEKDYFGMTMTTIGKFSDKDNGSHIAGEDIVITAPWGMAQKGSRTSFSGLPVGNPCSKSIT